MSINKPNFYTFTYQWMYHFIDLVVRVTKIIKGKIIQTIMDVNQIWVGVRDGSLY